MFLWYIRVPYCYVLRLYLLRIQTTDRGPEADFCLFFFVKAVKADWRQSIMVKLSKISGKGLSFLRNSGGAVVSQKESNVNHRA